MEEDKLKEVKPPRKPIIFYYGIILLVIILLNAFVFPMISNQFIKDVDYGTFLTMVEDGEVAEVQIEGNYINFTTKNGTENNVYRTGVIDDPQLVERLHNENIQFSKVIPREMSPLLSFLMFWILPLVIFILIGRYFSKKMMEKMGGGASPMSFGKSKAKIYVQAETGFTFDDVAGQEEAKEALKEIVDFLHNPEKYKEIGAKIPKGALLSWPSGNR